MYRRKNPSDMEDEVNLVESKDNGPLPAAAESSEAHTWIREETHVIPNRFSKVRRRLINKAVSPNGRLLYWWITVSCLGVLSFLFALVPLVIKPDDTQECADFIEDGNELPYFYRKDRKLLEICRQKELIFNGTLGLGRNYIRESRINVFTFSHASTLSISSLDTNCIRVEWRGLSSQEVPLQDCYELGLEDTDWYGAYEHLMQSWPINQTSQGSFDSIEFLPRDYLSDHFVPSNAFGPILHPLWLNTKGVGILVDENVPLHVSMNNSHLCLIAKPFELDCTPSAEENATLAYTVCLFDTVAKTSRHFLNQTVKPVTTPSPEVFQKPIWSTWAEFKTNITSSKIGEFCSNISRLNFNASHIEIDDGYSQFYGELNFSADVDVSDPSFSNCNQFNLTAWVHPFVNHDASNFREGLDSGTFLPGISEVEENSISLVKWWQGYGAVINFMNSSVASMHANSLLQFKSNNRLVSFKFDAGEYTYLPKCVYIQGLTHPGEYTRAYVKFVGNQSYAEHAEVRVGYFTQDQPVLVRILDRTSTWGVDNGLRSVLNAVLSIGLGGYLFVIPDMIGGNGVTANVLDSTTLPSEELFIRWVQLSAFLPVMQFSIAPWKYSTNATNHIRALTQLHYDLQFDVLASSSLETGYPIVRPLWWKAVDQNDEKTWTVSDQFFVGDDYMIAPVLTMDQRERDVYFPLGSNYSVVHSAVSVSSTCPNKNLCLGGSTHTFTVGLFEVLYFRVIS